MTTPLANKDTNEPTFELYKLRVEISDRSGKIIGNHKAGDYFEVVGEDIFLPANQGFSLYAIASLLPLLTAKQREIDPNDWMSSDNFVADPDPLNETIYEIKRLEQITFRRSDVTATQLPAPGHE